MPLRDHIQKRRGPSSATLISPRIVALSAILALLLVGGAVLYGLGQSSLIKTDSVTLCPVKQAPADITVILLDVSDQFSEPQRLKLSNELKGLTGNVSRFGLIEVYSVDRIGERVVTPIVHLC